jgi:hypothetical protein
MGGGFGSGGALLGRLAERHADLERLIAEERARPVPDELLIRRLSRERLLARDRMAALSGCAMPRWAREGATGAD